MRLRSIGGMALAWRFSRAEFELTTPSQLNFRLVESRKKELEQAANILSSAPDGNLRAFAKIQNRQPDIYVKQVDGDAPRNLTNDVWNDYGPIWSPDGTSIAYLSVLDERYAIWLVSYSTARKSGWANYALSHNGSPVGQRTDSTFITNLVRTFSNSKSVTD